MVYQISKVCLALMYMQHKHILYGGLHIYHYLVLDQNVNDNYYSTSLPHDVWNVDHKMIMLLIYLCFNTFSRIGVQHQHYHEHDTVYLSILFPWIVFVFSLIDDTLLRFSFVRWCWNSLAKLTSYFWLPVCIFIWESNLFEPGSLTVDINSYI